MTGTKKSRPQKDPTGSLQIDKIIESTADWRGNIMADLRASISKVDPYMVEEVKWKKPSNPLGIPVWSYDGIICFGNILKNSVRLTFPKGASINDPSNFFNTRLDSKSVRAIDIHEEDDIDETALKSVILQAIRLNKKRTQVIQRT
jgi:hypothetical protein